MSTEWKRVRDTLALIVQFRSESRHHYLFVETLRALFYHTELGVVDGTDSGGGKFHVYVYDIHDADWVKAAELTSKELARLELLEEAVIAQSVSWESDDDERIDYKVVWPLSHEGEFSIW